VRNTADVKGMGKTNQEYLSYTFPVQEIAASGKSRSNLQRRRGVEGTSRPRAKPKQGPLKREGSGRARGKEKRGANLKVFYCPQPCAFVWGLSKSRRGRRRGRRFESDAPRLLQTPAACALW